ncbi:MAG: DMT family transporter [Pseudomonadota bacterium]|nr:DMT family transporter [Pseudomonadota bacterium]
MTLATPALAASFWIAVGLVCAANVLLPLQDAFARAYVQALPVWQVLLVRSATVLVLALLIGRARVVARARRARNLRWIALRALLNLAAWGSFYLALRDISLAQAVTLYFFSPILVALAAGPLLGERVGLGQWAAIAAGFAGVALASGAASFDVSAATGWALLAAALWAATMLMLRAFSGEEGALAQLVIANAVFVAATGACALVFGWRADLSQTLGIAAAGMLGGAGQFAIYEAARRIPASTLAALEYGALVSGFGLGWLMFDEIPTAAVWGGAAMVLVSGVAMVGLERARVRGPLAPAVARAAEAEADPETNPDTDTNPETEKPRQGDRP